VVVVVSPVVVLSVVVLAVVVVVVLVATVVVVPVVTVVETVCWTLVGSALAVSAAAAAPRPSKVAKAAPMPSFRLMSPLIAPPGCSPSRRTRVRKT
jgi:hypothetical protein